MTRTQNAIRKSPQDGLQTPPTACHVLLREGPARGCLCPGRKRSLPPPRASARGPLRSRAGEPARRRATARSMRATVDTLTKASWGAAAAKTGNSFSSTNCGGRSSPTPTESAPASVAAFCNFHSKVGIANTPPTTANGNLRWMFTAKVRISPKRFQTALPTATFTGLISMASL